jgi:hypothetical protein
MILGKDMAKDERELQGWHTVRDRLQCECKGVRTMTALRGFEMTRSASHKPGEKQEHSSRKDELCAVVRRRRREGQFTWGCVWARFDALSNVT